MTQKDSWQQQRKQRQQQMIQRRAAVFELLQEAHQQRQISASQIRSELSLFRETLSHNAAIRRQALSQYCETLTAQTQAFLSISRAERALTAQQLNRDLNTFQTTLTQTVTDLRRDLESDLQRLRIETQALLDQAQQQRLKTQIRLTRNLAIFVERLRSTVTAFLANAQLERQEQALSLAHSLQQSRLDRQAEVETLFQGMSEFRSQLAQYRSDLSSAVWGECQDSTQKSPISVPSVGSTLHQASSRQASIGGATQSDEQKVYDYIEVMQGAQLAEIESALSLSRSQAVEALRSLILRGKVTQREREYLISNNLQ